MFPSRISLITGLVLGTLIACGSSNATVDAPTTLDAPLAPDASGVDCTYVEQRDATNNGTPETIGLVVGAAPIVICGDVNSGHFDSEALDVDTYKFTASGDVDTLWTLTASGAAALNDVNFYLLDVTDTSYEFGVSARARFIVDHAVTSAHLVSGHTYQVKLQAQNPTAIAASFPYRIKVEADAPATRCPTVTTPTYTEAADGVNSNGNDMIDSTVDGWVLTTATTEAPEASGITVAPSTRYLIDGVGGSVTVNPHSEYLDRDTYKITTGATTNQLAIRLNWTGADHLDWLLFQETTTKIVVDGSTVSFTAPEFQTFAVKPNTSYWLFIATVQGSTALPVNYGATLCGEQFTAP